MKVTKFVHSCLLVEMPEPVNRTVIFDPGVMSEDALNVSKLRFLDDIVITHSHSDHLSMSLIKQLVAKFPEVNITTTQEVVDMLAQENVTAHKTPPGGIVFFDSPHEHVEPIFPLPEQIGVHYLDLLTHPGDCHSFSVTKPVLALPVTGPWGSMIRAVNLALELKPRYIIPIHDWHWSHAARLSSYDSLQKFFTDHNIEFIKPQTGVPFTIEV